MANKSRSLQPGLATKPPLPHVKSPMEDSQSYQMIQHGYYGTSTRFRSLSEDEDHLEERSQNDEERFLAVDCADSSVFDKECEILNHFSTINVHSYMLRGRSPGTCTEDEISVPQYWSTSDFKMSQKSEPIMSISAREERLSRSVLTTDINWPIKDKCETELSKQTDIMPHTYSDDFRRDFISSGNFVCHNSEDLEQERNEDSAYVSEECLTEDQCFMECEKENDKLSRPNSASIASSYEETKELGLHKNVSRESISSMGPQDTACICNEEPNVECLTPNRMSHSEAVHGSSLPVKSQLPTMDESEEKNKNISTYGDILNILKIIEDEQILSLHLSKDEKKTNDKFSYVNEDKLGLVMDENPSLSSFKLKDLHNYLDEVNKSSENALKTPNIVLQPVRDHRENNLKLVKFEELMTMSSVDLAHEVFTLQLQLEEKSNGLALLQETLNQQRESTIKNARQADRDMKNRLKQQKVEYEAAINRHQKFIDQLIGDKKNLSEKCEAVVKELKTNEERHAFNLKASEERHRIEIQRARETFAAAEKLRRERWIDNRTKKIKEMTVKGLEPELQRMNTRHQHELSDLRLLHKQELEEMGLRATRRSTQQMEQLREQLTKEKEETIAREKELIRQKLEKQIEQEEATYQKQHQKLLAEVQQEKERLSEEEKKMRNEHEETKKNLTRQYSKDLQQVKLEYEDSLEGIKRRHQNELKAIKETLEVEKETWMHNYKHQQAALLSEREGDIREQYKRERDREIELVIERLENDAMQAKKEQELMAENRLKRLKEKYDAEVKDLMTSEESLKSKYEKIKLVLIEKEDEIINLKTNLRQCEKELQECKKITDRLSEERSRVKDIVKQEFTDKILLMEQENIRLHERMAEAKAKHEMELSKVEEGIDKIKSEKEKELAEVYNRVKLTIGNKDKTIHHLKIQHESSLQRCSHLQELLEQQRRDYLLK